MNVYVSYEVYKDNFERFIRNTHLDQVYALRRCCMRKFDETTDNLSTTIWIHTRLSARLNNRWCKSPAIPCLAKNVKGETTYSNLKYVRQLHVTVIWHHTKKAPNPTTWNATKRKHLREGLQTRTNYEFSITSTVHHQLDSEHPGYSLDRL